MELCFYVPQTNINYWQSNLLRHNVRRERYIKMFWKWETGNGKK